MLRLALSALFAAFVAFAPMQSASAQQQPVTAFAAASLQDALTAIAGKFTGETGIRVRFSFASSAVLAKQIEQGAPADVFASADIDWMEWAQEHNLVKHHYPFTLTASAKGDGPAVTGLTIEGEIGPASMPFPSCL